MSFYKPKYFTFFVRLRRENFANYLNYYHKNDGTSDFVYKVLTDLVTKHKHSDEYKSPVTNEGFYFKLDNPICKNMYGRPCLISDILDNDVMMKVKITTYDFVADGKRLNGLSLAVKEITVQKERPNN